jgi:hypothetical protein
MSDRRTKERERVWGRRPVILRFDPGHPRRHVEPEAPVLSDRATSDLLAAFFQSVIQTDGIDPARSAQAAPPPRAKGWHVVETGETATQPVRKPVALETGKAAVEEAPAETQTAVIDEPAAKPRHRPFWRLQTPHLFLNVISPEKAK